MSKYKRPGSTVWGPRNLNPVRFSRKPDWELIYATFIIVSILAIVYLLSGCATPANVYSYKMRDPNTGLVLKEGLVKTPQNTAVEGLRIVTSSGATIEVKKLGSENDPAVISAQGKREADNATATGGAIGNVIGTAAKAAAGLP